MKRCTSGGSGAAGTLFKLNTDGTGFTNLHSFSAIPDPYQTNGGGVGPNGLILSANTLFGTATMVMAGFPALSLGNGNIMAVSHWRERV
jgi:hypothetical protein